MDCPRRDLVDVPAWSRIDTAVGLMEASTTAADLWATTLRCLPSLLPPARPCQIGVWNGRPVFRAWHNTDARFVEAFNVLYHEALPLSRAMVTGVGVVSWERHRGTRFYTELLRPQGIAWTLVGLRGDLVLCLHRGPEDPRFTDSDIAAFDVLLTHLLRLTTTLRRRRAERDTVSAAELEAGTRVLSPREAEVARLLCRRLTARQIAAALGLGVRTVECHAGHIYAKLDVGNRRELRLRLLGKRAGAR